MKKRIMSITLACSLMANFSAISYANQFEKQELSSDTSINQDSINITTVSDTSINQSNIKNSENTANRDNIKNNENYNNINNSVENSSAQNDEDNKNARVYSFIESDLSTQRIYGLNRIQTAIAISEFQNEKSSKVIIANADKFPDALAASGITNGKYPVLLTQGELSENIILEIKRLDASEIIILGGTNSVPSLVEEQLKNIPSVKNINRLSGEDRYDTCKKIFEYSKKGSIVLANGENFPDALAASSLLKDSALILTKKENFSTPIESIIQNIQSNDTKIIGGENTISKTIANELISKYGFGNYERISGVDRFATSVKIAEKHNSKNVIIASGESFPDALAASTLSQKINSPILLVSKDNISNSVIEYFKSRVIEKAIILGGESTISENTKNNIEKLIKGENITQDINSNSNSNLNNNSTKKPNSNSNNNNTNISSNSNIVEKNMVTKSNIKLYNDISLESYSNVVPNKKIVDVIEQNDEYIKIKYNDMTGWTLKNNLDSYNPLSFGKVVNKVPYISQLYPVYAPNGCEPTSMLMGLQGKGYTNMNLRTFLDKMPKTNSNPAKGYVGVPYNVEQGRFQTIDPEPLAQYGRKYGNVVNIQGASINDIIKEIQNGNTVVAYETLFWNKAYYRTLPIDGVKTRRIWNNHVVLLTGYDPINMSFYIADPYNHEKAGGNRSKPFYYWKSQVIVERCYNYDNRKFAVVIR